MKFNQIANWELSSISATIKSQYNLGLPIHLTIEPTNICNLHCPVCETGAGILQRDKGFMSFDVFKEILSKVGRQVNTLLLYYMGEPFLNKDIYKMIEHVVERGIYVSVCTNGEMIDTEALAESNVSEVSFQIGGISQATHEIYRVGGNLQKVMDNVTKLVQLRKGKHPKIIIGYIVMRHNEHELEHLSELRDIGVDDVQVINPCVRTIEQGRQYLPDDIKYWFYDRKAFGAGILKPRQTTNNRCWWLYYSTVITWDGLVVPCCRDAQVEYVMGNILNDKFSDIWNGTKYRQFRHTVATKQAKLKLCQLCSGYGIARLY